MTERDIFIAALQKETQADREAYLDQACAGQPELREQVEGLLRLYENAESFLEQPAIKADGNPAMATTAMPAPAIDGPGSIIGPYKLLEQIGEGGFGVVYLAEQSEPVRRKVALKILKPGMDTRQIVARFEAERQALAIMDHPNIAKVFDGGSTETGGWRLQAGGKPSDLQPPDSSLQPAGLPYFVMELVKGIPITDYCDQNHLTPRQRLELFIPVCQAVQHAHQKGIIHRDLKPSNVLVTRHDSTAVPKVIDFGVAKALSQELTDKTLHTGIAQMIGTPLYMSPEQAGMSDLDVDTRSDIYSLGVLLYELLTGTTPFEKERFKQAAYDEIRRIIREEEPPKPSTRLSDLSRSRLPGGTPGSSARRAGPTSSLASVSALRQTEPAKLTKLVRGELDWIVMKALEKDRNRRYETANGFAIDIQRFLADEPVQACPPSVGYRLRKFVKRNKGAMLSASAIVLLLLMAIAGTSTGMVRALAAERRAVKESDAKEIARQKAVAAAAAEAEARQKAVAAAAAEAEARRQTRQALNTMTDEVVEELLVRQLQLTDRHREFLQKVLAYHAAFAAAKGDTTEGRQSRAEGYLNVSRIRSALGELTDAEAACRDALALYKQLADDSPTETNFLRQLAVCHSRLSILLRDTGRLEEAESVSRTALALYTQLDKINSPEIRQDFIRCKNLLAILLIKTSRPKEAESAFREALALQKELVDHFSDKPHFAQDLGQFYSNLGTFLRGNGQSEEAEKAYNAALAVQKQLLADNPGRSGLLDDLARSYGGLSLVLSDVRQWQEAEKTCGAALALRKQLADKFPGRPDFCGSLALNYNHLGLLLRATGRPKDAESAFRDALALQKQLVADFYARLDFRQELARTHNNMGLLLVDQKNYAEAEKAYAAALALHKQLAADVPKNTDYQNELALDLVNLAILHNHRQEYAAAVSLVEQAGPHHQAALKNNLNNSKYRENYRLNLRTLAWSQFGLADHARLAATAHDLARLGYDPANENYIAACYLSLCITLVEKDARLAEAKRKELAQSYADRALALLRQAIAHGYKDAASMRQVSELEPLRGREEFKKLLNDLEGKSKE